MAGDIMVVWDKNLPPPVGNRVNTPNIVYHICASENKLKCHRKAYKPAWHVENSQPVTPLFIGDPVHQRQTQLFKKGNKTFITKLKMSHQAGSNLRPHECQSNARTTKPAIAAAEWTEKFCYLSDNHINVHCS